MNYKSILQIILDCDKNDDSKYNKTFIKINQDSKISGFIIKVSPDLLIIYDSYSFDYHFILLSDINSITIDNNINKNKRDMILKRISDMMPDLSAFS